MTQAFLLTGSNMGNSRLHLDAAANAIQKQIGAIALRSSYYKTAPWGNPRQQDFLNQVLLVNTLLEPEELMHTLLEIESTMGRQRQTKWEPRMIDIDILYYADQIIRQETLVIPHPLLHERRFTLEPLVEIAPDWMHPVLQKTSRQLLEACPDSSKVEKLSVSQ